MGNHSTGSNAFSPLTSPVLVPNASGSRQWPPPSMPPPSPSITAEHIMRRQQQQQQQQQQQASMSGEWQPPALPSTTRARGRRGTSTSASPHHHPYRAPTQPASRMFSPVFASNMASATTPNGMDNEEFLLDALAESPALQSVSSSAAAAAATAAIIASLNNTPVLQFAGSAPAQTAIAAELSGLHLPDAVAGAAADHAHSRTLHQLNMSPHESSQALMSASLAQQMSAWLDQTSAQDTVPSSTPVMATPAMLMNLPVSAHHLPHTSTGGIVAKSTDQQQADALPAHTFEVSASMSMHAQATQSAPMSEFIHPPAPPPLRIGPSQSNQKQTPSSGDAQTRGRRKSVSTASDITAADKPAEPKAGGTRARRGEASRARRRSRATQLLSPRTTPLVPSILKDTLSPGISPSLAPLTPSTLPHARLAPASSSLATTPQMRPRPVVAATSTTNIVGRESDVVTRLATKSNYQNIMEGNSEQLGLTYRTEFKSGLERRRTNHKNAEQKRRDSLKLCFQGLRERVPDVDPKLVSKIYLLSQASAYIDRLKLVNERLVEAMRAQGVDVDDVVARAVEEARERQGSVDDEQCLSDGGPDMELDG
ncbi:hypothetical protein GGF43_000413 [Coemansia sp. RSA 2618]|nr:hypothetical protein GGF43_000413 [Coemansia sp. RSA 2618]